MGMLRTIIIDDEKAAIQTLSLLLKRHIADVSVIAMTTSAANGIEAIEKEKPDVVFLDISMQDMDGFSLLQRLNYRNFHLIFTTAHERYALKAIKHHAFDYLVKPIDIDELKQAIQAITILKPEIAPHSEILAISKLTHNNRIGLPIKEGLVYHLVADIIWIASDGNYCTFYTSDTKKYVVSKNIGEYQDILPDDLFFRVHKSYLINIKRVKKFIRSDGYFVEMEDGSKVEISRRKKDEFLRLMNGVG